MQIVTNIFFILELDEDNPLWIGAWWMGFVIVGSIVLSLAPLMTLFPALIPPPEGIQTDAVAIRKQLGESGGPSTAKEWWADFFKIREFWDVLGFLDFVSRWG